MSKVDATTLARGAEVLRPQDVPLVKVTLLHMPSAAHPRPAFLITALASAVIALMACQPAQASVCDRVAAPNGSNSASGTPRHPFQSAQRLVEALRAGQTGCLRTGIYRQDVTIRRGGRSNAPLVVRSFPGEAATILGRLYIARGADYTTVSNLGLVGIEHGRECGSRLCASPAVDANHTTFVRDDVTNRHADAICFVLGDANGVYGSANDTTIRNSRIHDCGKLPPANLEHGIYVENSAGSRILDNLIYDNSDRGVQLYPNASHTLVRGNVIYGNGEGVDFAGNALEASSNNTVTHNIIVNSRVLYNVMSSYSPGQVGTGNVVDNNCIGGGPLANPSNRGGIRYRHEGFAVYHNRIRTPQFADAANAVFSLPGDSKCRRLLVAHKGSG